MKQRTSGDPQISLSVRVSQGTAERLKRLADANYRPVATELRRLIEEHVERADAELLTAAEKEAA